MEGLLEAAIRLSLPLLIAALGELVVERAGLINIGTEGMMLCGAFAGYAVAVATGSPAVGVLGAVAVGLVVGSLFAFFAVVRGTDQIVVGTAINLLALGATGLAARALYEGSAPSAPGFRALSIPLLSELPLVGSVLFRQTPYAYGAALLALAAGIHLARTRAGLRLRAVGESARAADAQGVSVRMTRIGAVLVGSTLAAIAGSTLTLAQSNIFTEGMTAGRGFIALTIVIFGRWSASGVTLAALFFGTAVALQHRVQARGIDIPYQVSLMLPYVLTLVVLAFGSRGSGGPADLGKTYRREAL
jgi:ABC-type uncharacterized transport system permease subunit